MSTLRITFAILSLVCTNAFAQTSFWADRLDPRYTRGNKHAAPLLSDCDFIRMFPDTLPAIQFYKGSNNTGTHTGALWSSTARGLRP